MARYLRVYLLIAGPTRRLFYSEVAQAPDAAGADDEDDDEALPTTGPRGWLDRVFRRASEAWRRSEGATTRRCRSVWAWLHRWAHPDEVLYSRLRRVRRIDLSYPESLGAAEARAEWARFLVRGRWRHWPWLLVNLALAPVSVLMAPIPGPNLIGYWFVYRAIHHLYILYGLGRVRAGRVVVDFQGVEALDQPLTAALPRATDDGRANSDWVARLGCDPAELRGFLERQGMARATVAGVEGGRVMTEGGPSGRWPRRLVNGLTLSRLALAGAFPALPEAWWGPAAVAGGLTDLVDGWISRRFGATSTFGQVADPIADKALVASVLLTLWHDGRFPAWHLPLVAARDLAVAGGTAWVLLRRGGRAIGQMPPSPLGKAATAGQFVSS